MKDYYQILGVPEDASEEEIRRAFFELAKKYHPDRGGDEEKFKEINEAYQVLSNKEKRAAYDAQRKGGGFFEEGFSFPSFDFDSLFEDDFFSFDFFERKKRRGEDLYLEVELTLKEAFFGKEKEIRYHRKKECSLCKGKGYLGEPIYEVCPHCGGRGKIKETRKIFFGVFSQIKRCPFCQGEGRILKNPCVKCQGEGAEFGEEKIKVKFEPGIREGEILKIEGKGNWEKDGAGDLYLQIKILPDEKFERRGDDLYLKVPVDIVKAALGGEIEIENLDGEKIKIKFPPLKKSGEKIVLKGKGMPLFKENWKRGDLIVEFEIVIPQKLSSKAKKLLEELKKEIS